MNAANGNEDRPVFLEVLRLEKTAWIRGTPSADCVNLPDLNWQLIHANTSLGIITWSRVHTNPSGKQHCFAVEFEPTTDPTGSLIYQMYDSEPFQLRFVSVSEDYDEHVFTFDVTDLVAWLKLYGSFSSEKNNKPRRFELLINSKSTCTFEATEPDGNSRHLQVAVADARIVEEAIVIAQKAGGLCQVVKLSD